MNWDSPSQTKWYAGAAAAVLVAGMISMNMNRMPVLSASGPAPVSADADLRDAVASPSLVPGAAGWLGTAMGAAAMGRAAHNPSLLNREAQPTLRTTSGRTVFGSPRVIVEQIKPGSPEPSVSPKPSGQAGAVSARLDDVAQAFLARAAELKK